MKGKMKILAGVFTAILMIFSCEPDENFDNSCDVRNPVEDLDWLNTRIRQLESLDPNTGRYQFVSMAKYRGNSVFIFENCDPLAVSVSPVINCNNEQLGFTGSIPLDSLIDKKVIWKPAGSACH
jgi:hypothetical protein